MEFKEKEEHAPACKVTGLEEIASRLN